WATTWQPTLSSVALVATTPTVVLPKRVRREPAAARAVAMSRARLSSAPGTPAAFTTTSAATTRSPARAPAVTTPPGRRGGSSPGAGGGSPVATVAPVPAPTRPSSTGPSVAATQAA